MQQLTFYKAYKVIFVVVVVVVVVVVCVCKRVLQTYHMLISSFYLVDRVEIFFIQWRQKDKILIVFNMMQDFYVLSIKINHRTYEESLLYLVYTHTSKIWVLSYFSYGFQWLKPKLHTNSRTASNKVQIYEVQDLVKDNHRPTIDCGIFMQNTKVNEVQKEREDEQSCACHELLSLLGFYLFIFIFLFCFFCDTRQRV